MKSSGFRLVPDLTPAGQLAGWWGDAAVQFLGQGRDQDAAAAAKSAAHFGRMALRPKVVRSLPTKAALKVAALAGGVLGQGAASRGGPLQ